MNLRIAATSSTAWVVHRTQSPEPALPNFVVGDCLSLIRLLQTALDLAQETKLLDCLFQRDVVRKLLDGFQNAVLGGGLSDEETVARSHANEAIFTEIKAKLRAIARCPVERKVEWSNGF